MRRFWEERYCAGLMRLVVVGPQPLPELEALVRARFGAVRNLGAAVPAFPSAQSSLLYVVPPITLSKLHYHKPKLTVQKEACINW